jgi:RHH-type proline utilization regulon transcriptional repressor/proline dehydrogenase/delta 1-pyrroline-5-carboxylate dehydrogenase
MVYQQLDDLHSAGAAVTDAGLVESRAAILRAEHTPEPLCVPALIEAAGLPEALAPDVQALVARLVRQLRAERTRASGVDALMREFSLSSQDGVALMCLAEALLRIPDRANRDRLIRDKLGAPIGGRMWGRARRCSSMRQAGGW